eukprot:TRINITY_DN8306_c0_g1_i1.p1 TRINITY_DN8306_c0_g1~~TRINITY_DN8306_c0_g1_i1.p1  ORF type:complete len:379 (+),score=67.50 TRINITY_DN8306_c0_g1_i1:93-1229(+)
MEPTVNMIPGIASDLTPAIFVQLRGKDLLNASQVCKSWRSNLLQPKSHSNTSSNIKLDELRVHLIVLQILKWVSQEEFKEVSRTVDWMIQTYHYRTYSDIQTGKRVEVKYAVEEYIRSFTLTILGDNGKRLIFNYADDPNWYNRHYFEDRELDEEPKREVFPPSHIIDEIALLNGKNRFQFIKKAHVTRVVHYFGNEMLIAFSPPILTLPIPSKKEIEKKFIYVFNNRTWFKFQMVDDRTKEVEYLKKQSRILFFVYYTFDMESFNSVRERAKQIIIEHDTIQRELITVVVVGLERNMGSDRLGSSSDDALLVINEKKEEVKGVEVPDSLAQSFAEEMQGIWTRTRSLNANQLEMKKLFDQLSVKNRSNTQGNLFGSH